MLDYPRFWAWLVWLAGWLACSAGLAASLPHSIRFGSICSLAAHRFDPILVFSDSVASDSIRFDSSADSIRSDSILGGWRQSAIRFDSIRRFLRPVSILGGIGRAMIHHLAHWALKTLRPRVEFIEKSIRPARRHPEKNSIFSLKSV